MMVVSNGFAELLHYSSTKYHVTMVGAPKGTFILYPFGRERDSPIANLRFPYAMPHLFCAQLPHRSLAQGM